MGYSHYAMTDASQFPHRFANKRDRDAWVDEFPMTRWRITRDDFIEAVEEIGEFVEHENEELEGFLMEWDGEGE